ncbi:MAG: type II toxin-antitoxin system VapC family toxin [Candidatus Atribacteria bacterium]|nr:type II toxin-antitoxin system VapC family toxin [Candidatus Atribacteria bacterium]
MYCPFGYISEFENNTPNFRYSAVRAAEIRSTYKLRTPDAIHLATAWENQATLFLTNDLDFPPEIGAIRIIHLNQFS